MIDDLRRQVEALQNLVNRQGKVIQHLQQQALATQQIAGATQPYFPPEVFGLTGNSGFGVGPAGGITAGSTGTVTLKRWNGASLADLSPTRTETMRNTAVGVDVPANGRVAWQWHEESQQYICTPLEC